MPRARAQRRASNQIEKMKKVITMDPSIWGRLPDELLDRIIAFLPLRTILALRPTCRRFRSFLSSPAFLSLLHAHHSASYLLLSHPQFSDRCLPIYDPVADQWRSVSLPSSFADACSPSSVLLSSASGLLCFSLGRSALLVANLLTSSLKVLPLPVYSASSPSAVTLVSFPSPCNSKRGYKIFLPSDSADAVFIYDSASLAWTRFPAFESVLRRGNPRQAGAFFEASLYFTTPEPFSVVGFDLRSGSWDIEAAPALPEDMAFVRLVGGGDRLYLVGGVGRDGISRSLKIWELVGRAWEELGRLPEMMCRKFVSVCYHNYSHVQCLWHEGLVCVCCITWPEVLFYRVARGTWHWLPRCPMLQEKWSCGFHWFSFSPDLFALPRLGSAVDLLSPSVRIRRDAHLPATITQRSLPPVLARRRPRLLVLAISAARAYVSSIFSWQTEQGAPAFLLPSPRSSPPSPLPSLFFSRQKRRHLVFPRLDARSVAMFNDSDTIDDFLSPTETTTGRQLGKFRPKARAKSVKVVSASTKTSDASQETEQAHLQPCTSSNSLVACQNGSTAETVQQPKVTQTESGASQGKHADNFQLNKEILCQDESTSLSLNTSNDDPLKLTEAMFNDLDSVDVFLCPLETTKEQQLGKFRPKVRAKTAKVVSASTKTSDDARHVSAPLESISHDAHSELQTDKTCFQSCMSSCSTVSRQHRSMPESVQQPEVMQTELVASRGKHADNFQLNEGNLCQDENTSLTLNASDDVPLKTAGIEEITDNIDHATTVSEQSIMSDAMLRPLEVLMSDDDLHPSSSDLQEEIEVLCGLESFDNLSVQHGSKMEVGKVSKFKPKVTKLPSKKATVKSVSFILPDASCSAIPVESISAMDTSSIQATIHSPADNPLHTSDAALDWNGEHQVDYARIGEENNGENELQRVPEGIDVMSEFQFIEEPNHQNLDRTTSENDTNVGATISTRKLRKRTVKSMAGNLEGRIDGDCDAEVDESQSNDGQEVENMPKPKTASRKRKGQTTEDPKPAKRGKKVSSIADSSVEESSKKKFPHATRRKRRQVNKILLQTPEEEIDRRQISIKDLIMLAEAKERISTKEPTATGNLFSNQSSLDEDNGLFGDDEEMNRGGGGTSYPNQPTTKKLNYHSYSNRLPTVRWSKSETQLLYEAIRQFGSDFEMIQQLFPNRTRHQIKLKFKIEERKHPLQVRDALFHRSEDFSHVMQVIKMVREKAEASAKEETNDDQENASQCNVDTNEKEAEGIADEGDDYGGRDEDAGYPDFDEHEWDSSTYRRDKEEDSIWDF